MNPCVPPSPVASTSNPPSDPVGDDPDIIDLPWLFTDSDIENADPPPGGWNLNESYDIDTDEETTKPDPPPPGPAALVQATSAVAKHATAPLLQTATLPASTSTSTIRPWASHAPASPMIPKARVLAKVKQSPLALRGLWRKHLSVTDIVSVAWCELQVDYGIRGLRHRPLAERPKTFKSREGKTIAPKVEVAQTNNERMVRGTTVHKKLEKEIAPIQIVVTAKGNEEIWALRLMNIIVCFRSLALLGACRELPVFGFLKDTLVLGAIDEIIMRPSSASTATENGRRLSALVETSPGHIPSGETASSHPPLNPVDGSSAVRECPLDKLFVLDSKTRSSRSLPPKKDMKSTRMQLMIYRHLLCDLIYPTHPAGSPAASKRAKRAEQSSPPELPLVGPAAFNFERVWNRAGINSRAAFTDAFSAQLLELAESNDIPFEVERIRTIEAVAQLFDKEAATLMARVSGVSKSLEVTYRTRRTATALPPSPDLSDRKRKRTTSPPIQVSSGSDNSGSGTGRLRRKRKNGTSPESSTIDVKPFIAQEVQLTRSAAMLTDDEDFALQAAIAMSLADSPPTPPDTTTDVDMETDTVEIHVISSSQKQATSGSSEPAIPTITAAVVDAANADSIGGESL